MGVSRLSVEKNEPLREKIYAVLKRAILSGELKPETRLLEEKLANQLQVSRTPIREAFRKLEQEGLIDVFPKGGVKVKGVSLEDVIEIYRIRGVLEGLAASLACDHVTEDEIRQMSDLLARSAELCHNPDPAKASNVNQRFHEMISRASRSRRLIKIITNLRSHCVQYEILLCSQERLKTVLEEHTEILEYIARRDKHGASAAVDSHVLGTAAFIASVVGERGGESG